jgi:hypothetical protein
MRKLILAVVLDLSIATAAIAQPTISYIAVPPAGPGGEAVWPIEGRVEGAPPGAVIVIWAKNREGIEWVQPLGSAYKTQLNGHGEWKTVTHPGVEYTVALVRPTFTTPTTRTSLPAIGDEIFDMVTVRPGR